jgi:hypothetical protein
MKVDLDVRVRLENKICVALLRLFLDEWWIINKQ